MKATWPGPWTARRWAWGSALAWWGERQTETETETWEEVGEEAQICCVACLTLEGHRRVFWILPTTPAPAPTPTKPRLRLSPASAKQTKASMSRWVSVTPHADRAACDYLWIQSQVVTSCQVRKYWMYFLHPVWSVLIHEWISSLREKPVTKKNVIHLFYRR